MTSSAPLQGIVVVEIGHSVAAPFAGLVFGQFGAEVIKVEHPRDGDHARSWGPPMRNGASALFHAINRDKLGVALDLREPAGREALLELILRRADVVIQNLRPNSVAALGLDARRGLAQVVTHLLQSVSVRRYRSIGRKARLRPADAGVRRVDERDRGKGRPPVRVGVSIVDIGTGMWSVIGILAALLERRGRQGRNRRHLAL